MSYVSITGSLDLSKTIRQLDGWDFGENAGTPAAWRVLLRDGGTSGAIVADIRGAASDSKHVQFARPKFFPLGLYVQVSVGTVRGSVDGR